MGAFARVVAVTAFLFCVGCERPEPSGKDLAKTFNDNRALFEASGAAAISAPYAWVEFDKAGHAKLTKDLPPPPSPPSPEALRRLEALHARSGVKHVSVGPTAIDFDMWDIGIAGSGRGKSIVYQTRDDPNLTVVPSVDAFEDRTQATHYYVGQKLEDRWYIVVEK